MKLKIYFTKHAEVTSPEVLQKGDWIDLYVPKYHGTSYKPGEFKKINLGISMKLPAGTEAILAFRSSTPFNYHVVIPSGIGIIDNSFCGNSDIWKLPIYTVGEGTIAGNSRICQFKIQLSQRATLWQKLKFLLSSGIEFVEVESLSDESRGGYGSTGK